MRTPKRILEALVAALALAAYVWLAAVRAVPGVRRRKEAARRRRVAGAPASPSRPSGE